jgi:cell fate regulator YaaT (PSP1 superfamily)
VGSYWIVVAATCASILSLINPIARFLMSYVALVRYGAVPEVGRFACALAETPARGAEVVVETHRGSEVGKLLQVLSSRAGDVSKPAGELPDDKVVRVATADDRARHDTLRVEAQQAWSGWQARIAEWQLELELIDLEWTLDRQKLILYVLGGRGADTTKLALQAATLGETVVEVQPVAADGVVPIPSGGGGGCGSGGCGCHE